MRTSPRHALASYGRSIVPHSLADVAPGLAMLVHYPRAYLRSDVLAGLTVGAVAVPASLAMAELAGVPVVYGLYGTLLPLAVYGLLGSSRQHVIGPDATLAALTAVTVAPLAVVGGEPDPGRYLALTAALALTMGLLLFAAGVLRLGFVADFFGKPVLLGYINGVALIVIASQLGKLFGITVDVDEFFPIIREVIGDLGDANGPTVLLSAVLLAVAVAVKRFLPVVPPSLVVLALALAIAAAVDLEARDIAVVGEVEGGLPSARPARRRRRLTSSICSCRLLPSRSSPLPISSEPSARSPRSTTTRSIRTVSSLRSGARISSAACRAPSRFLRPTRARPSTTPSVRSPRERSSSPPRWWRSSCSSRCR